MPGLLSDLDQLARAGGHHQALARVRLEPVAVGFARGERLALAPLLLQRADARLDSAIDHHRQRDRHIGGRLYNAHLVDRLVSGRPDDLAGLLLLDLRELADAEDDRVGEALRRRNPEVPPRSLEG